MTDFIGGGGPRFWLSVSPQIQQRNYAQIVLQVRDKQATPVLAPLWQQAISSEVPGAVADVRQLQTNPVEMPVAIRVSSETDVSPRQEAEDNRTLERIAGQVEAVLRADPLAARVRTDWRQESPTCASSSIPTAPTSPASPTPTSPAPPWPRSAAQVTTFQEGDREIPVVARLRMEERAQLSDLRNLYVYSSQGTQKVPITQIATLRTVIAPERIYRLEHFRTITVQAFPVAGALASQVIATCDRNFSGFSRTCRPASICRSAANTPSRMTASATWRWCW